MLNIGLKDIRVKPLILSSILRMNSSGSSDVSMSFGGNEVYIQMVSEGTSTTSLVITSIKNITLTSVGDSSTTMIFLDEGLPTKEILTFPSRIFLDVVGQSHVLLTREGNSKIKLNAEGDSHILKVREGNSIITKEITIKSLIDD